MDFVVISLLKPVRQRNTLLVGANNSPACLTSSWPLPAAPPCPTLLLQASSPFDCPVCKVMVVAFVQRLQDREQRQQIEVDMQAACNNLDPATKQRCLLDVTNLFAALDNLLHDVNPEGVCRVFAFCDVQPGGTTTAASVPPALRTLGAALSQLATGGPARAAGANGDMCQDCKTIVMEAAAILQVRRVRRGRFQSVYSYSQPPPPEPTSTPPFLFLMPDRTLPCVPPPCLPSLHFTCACLHPAHFPIPCSRAASKPCLCCVQDPKTQTELLEYAKEGCTVFADFKDQCVQYVTLYGPLVFNMLISYLQVKQLPGSCLPGTLLGKLLWHCAGSGWLSGAES